MSKESVAALGLAPGKEPFAVIKASNIMVAVDQIVAVKDRNSEKAAVPAHTPEPLPLGF